MAERILSPRDFDFLAKELFRDVLAVLKTRPEPEFVRVTDVPLLEQMCRDVMISRQRLDSILAREEEKAGTGWTTWGAQKQIVEHPDVKTRREALKAANAVGIQLMLSPKERHAHGLKVNAGKDKDDPFA